MSLRDSGLGLDVLEDEVGGVNLAVRVRVRDADGLPLVLEDEDVFDLGPAPEFAVLLLPDREQLFDLRRLKLGERQAVVRTVADDAGEPLGRLVAVDAVWLL